MPFRGSLGVRGCLGCGGGGGIVSAASATGDSRSALNADDWEEIGSSVLLLKQVRLCYNVVRRHGLSRLLHFLQDLG